MASSNGNSGFPMSRLQIALAVGATGAVGLAYWYLRQQTKEVKKVNLAGTKDSVSLDDSTQDILLEESLIKQAQRHKNEGNVLFKKGKYDEAILCYNKAIEVCPEEHNLDLATFYQNRAAAYEQLKKWSSVIADCTKALEHNQKYEKALHRRAKAYEIIKDWKNCLDDITAVCLLQNFGSQNALLMADRVLKELGKHHAVEAMKNRKPKLPSSQFVKTYFISFSADPVYHALVDTQEPLGEGKLVGFLKAKLAFATEDYDDVIPACTEEINSSESESRYIMEAISLRASFYLLSGCHKEALDDIKTIIDSIDCNYLIKVNALIKRASLNMQLDNLEECLKDFERAAELGPKVADVYHHRGQVHLLLEKVEEAMNDFNHAVELNPNFPIAVVQKCYAHYRYYLSTQNVDMVVRVMNDFKRATERFPNCSEVYVLYGQVLSERQEFDEADKQYIKAIEVDPANASVYVHRGLLMLGWQGDVNKSVELMNLAIKIDEKCEFAYETLGTVEVQRGNLVIAVDLFNKAIAFARTEIEMTHLFSLRDAAVSQLKVTTKLGIGAHLLKSTS